MMATTFCHARLKVKRLTWPFSLEGLVGLHNSEQLAASWQIPRKLSFVDFLTLSHDWSSISHGSFSTQHGSITLSFYVLILTIVINGHKSLCSMWTLLFLGFSNFKSFEPQTPREMIVLRLQRRATGNLYLMVTKEKVVLWYIKWYLIM